MRQTSAIGPLLLLNADELAFHPTPTDFAGIAADSLKDLPNLFAAIDADLADAAANVTGQLALGHQLDADLAEMTSLLDAMSADDFDSIAGDLAGAAGAADSMISDGNVDLPIGDFFAG